MNLECPIQQAELTLTMPQERMDTMSRSQTVSVLQNRLHWYLMRKYTRFKAVWDFEIKLGVNVAHRADCLLVQPYRQNGLVQIFEIKSCRSDFTSDGKWCAYLDHCNVLWFVVDQSFPLHLFTDNMPVGVLVFNTERNVPARMVKKPVVKEMPNVEMKIRNHLMRILCRQHNDGWLQHIHRNNPTWKPSHSTLTTAKP